MSTTALKKHADQLAKLSERATKTAAKHLEIKKKKEAKKAAAKKAKRG